MRPEARATVRPDVRRAAAEAVGTYFIRGLSAEGGIFEFV